MEGIAELLSAIFAFFLLLGGLIAVWVKINLKLKELDTKILFIEKQVEKNLNDILSLRKDDINTFKESLEDLWSKLDKIESKLDVKFDEITKIKAEHDQRVSCYYEKRLKKLKNIDAKLLNDLDDLDI